MKKNIFYLALIFFIMHCSLFTASAQSWKQLMDSTKSLMDKKNYNDAIVTIKKSLKQAEKEFGSLDTNYILTLNRISSIYNYIGNYDSSAYFVRLALNKNRELYNGDHQAISSCINNLAFIYQSQGKLSDAESLLIESYEMNKRIYKGDHQQIAISMGNLGTLYLNQMRLTEAESLFKESLEMKKRLFKGDHRSVAISLNYLGALYNEKGMLSEAESYYNESNEMNKRVYKGDNIEIATSLMSLAAVYKELGKLSESEKLFKESLDMRKRIFQGDHPGIASSLNGLAYVYRAEGRLNEADALYKETLEMRKRLFKSDNPDLAISLNNLATSCKEQGKFTEADSLYKESLGMTKRLYKSDHSQVALVLDNLAILYLENGKISEAESYNKESLEMYKRIFKGDHPDIAISERNLGRVLQAEGKFANAEPVYKESLEMTKRLFKVDHPNIVSCLNDISKLYQVQGRLNEAEPYFDESVNSTMNLVRRYFPHLSEKHKLDYWNSQRKYIESFNNFAIEYCKKKPEILNKMYDINIATKGLVVNSEKKSLEQIRASKRTYDNWINSRDLWLNLIQNPGKADKMRINVDSLNNVVLGLQKDLSQFSSGFRRTFDTTQISWIDIKNKLKTHEAAVEIVRFNKSQKSNNDSVCYVALIIKKDSRNPELIVINYGNELEDSLIKRYNDFVKSQKNKRPIFNESKNEFYDLYKQFWMPINDKLKDISTVYLSPDGVYNQLNLNTLYNKNSDKYLLEEIDLRLVTNTKDIVDSEKYDVESNSNDALLVGDPEFELPTDKISPDSIESGNYLNRLIRHLSQSGLPSLPGTKKEVEDVSKNLEYNKWHVVDLFGAQALESKLKKSKGPKILHLATHGIFLRDIEQISEVANNESQQKAYVENPLLRSMLLFAGAENTIKGQTINDEDDGILTAYEVMNLDLDNTDLVVLSACETGLGEVKNGEGVYGMQRAFQIAGANSLIMSLWTVSDDATQELMTTFYDRWLSGKSKRAAFREAQLKLKEKYDDFYLWGAFVMVGE